MANSRARFQESGRQATVCRSQRPLGAGMPKAVTSAITQTRQYRMVPAPGRPNLVMLPCSDLSERQAA